MPCEQSASVTHLWTSAQADINGHGDVSRSNCHEETVMERWKMKNTCSVGIFMTLWNALKSYFSAVSTIQKPNRPSVGDCKCYIMSGPVSWSNQGVLWGVHQEETSVVVRECCLLFSPDFNHLLKFVQEFTKCSLSYTHKHILGPSAHNPLWPSKSLNSQRTHTSHSFVGQRGVLSIIPLCRRNSLRARRKDLKYLAWRRRCSGVACYRATEVEDCFWSLFAW